MIDGPGTYGALLLGALFAACFSGIIASQCLVYLKLFPRDSNFLKGLVLAVWVIDIIHTGLIWSALWQCMIIHHGSAEYVDHIPLSIAFSVVLTASLTFFTQCFFALRIWRLSLGSWCLTFPVVVLALGRLALASASGGEMIRLQSYNLFRDEFKWLFSLGLGFSSGADILITIILFFLLQRSRSNLPSLNAIIDSLILYTFEIGTLTSIAAVATMICWILLDESLVFLGLHFVIGKLYANSLLASLNTRRNLRRIEPPSFAKSITFNTGWLSCKASDGRLSDPENTGPQIYITKSAEDESNENKANLMQQCVESNE